MVELSKILFVSLLLFFLTHAASSSEWPANYELTDGEKFDFIVVGSGSAGAIVAARLSEVPHFNVLLIEAGGDPPPASREPGLCRTLQSTEYDWKFNALLDEGIGQAHSRREVFYTRGKVLGGSTTINYLLYSRGVPEDYNDWKIPGWDWDSVLYYFKKFEGMTDSNVFRQPQNAQLHSAYGPVKVSRPENHPLFWEIDESRLNSFEELGIRKLLEHNGPDHYGVTRPHLTMGNGIRSSTAEAYLKPSADRFNLRVAKNAEVIKVLIDPITQIARGVEVKVKDDRIVNIYTNKEVILSAGSINSPKILLLSGIGPREDLSKLDINCIADLPVGKNLHDHPVVYLFIKGNNEITFETVDRIVSLNLDLPPGPVQNGYLRMYDSSTGDIPRKPQIVFFNTFFGYGNSSFFYYTCTQTLEFDLKYCDYLQEHLISHEIDALAVSLSHSLSRGQVKLKSKNPIDDPIIELGYLRNDTDLDVITRAVHIFKGIVNTTYFKEVNAEVLTPPVTGCEDLQAGSSEYWRCYVKNTITPFVHVVGSCKMAHDGVVDQRLKVHGIHGLRVIDASIIPLAPSGNTNAPAMMVGEKGADLIKEDYRVVMPRYHKYSNSLSIEINVDKNKL